LYGTESAINSPAAVRLALAETAAEAAALAAAEAHLGIEIEIVSRNSEAASITCAKIHGQKGKAKENRIIKECQANHLC